MRNPKYTKYVWDEENFNIIKKNIMKHHFESIPIEIIEAAEKVSNYAKMQGFKSGWTICGVADRHAYEELLECFKYDKNNSTFKDPYKIEL